MHLYSNHPRYLQKQKETPGLDLLAAVLSVLGIFLAAAYLTVFYCFPGTGLPGL